MSVGTGRQNIIILFWSFLGIHKWEPGIYIGFLPALHLQCEDDWQGQREHEAPEWGDQRCYFCHPGNSSVCWPEASLVLQIRLSSPCNRCSHSSRRRGQSWTMGALAYVADPVGWEDRSEWPTGDKSNCETQCLFPVPTGMESQMTRSAATLMKIRPTTYQKLHCKWRAGENPIKMSGSHLCIPRNETIISKTEL